MMVTSLAHPPVGNAAALRINEIHWTVAGKVRSVSRTPGSTREPLAFAYGASSQRTQKQVADPWTCYPSGQGISTAANLQLAMVSLTEPNLIHELEGLAEVVAGVGLSGWGHLNFTGPIKKP